MPDAGIDPTLSAAETLGTSLDAVVIPPPRLPNRFVPRPMLGARNGGEAVQDLPPLIEAMTETVPATVQPQLPATAHRPVRRSFLAPVAQPAPAPQAHFLDENEIRRLHPTRADLALLAGRAPTPNRPPEPALRVDVPAAEPEPGPVKPRRWPRRVAVGGGLVLALGAAVLLEIDNGPGRLKELFALVSDTLASAPSYLPGAEPPSDPVQRIAYYTQRAKGGDPAAMIALAVIYAKGDGTPQNYTNAARWFRAAADKGSARAQYDLGVLYERGRGVALDNAQAVLWYRKAAEQNHAMAQYNLAVACTKGQGIRQDFSEAAVWYHRAEAQGVVAAMVNLAILYERGDGVATSTVDAYAWYRAAARRGSQPAGRRAEGLLQAFSPIDQSRAEAKTTDIAASIRDPVGERARAERNPPERSLAAPASEPPAQVSAAKPVPESEGNSARGNDGGSDSP